MPPAMMRLSLAIALLLLAIATCAAASPGCRAYNTTSRRDPTKLNVHLVPHTLADGGWLKTFDQYYYGARQEIQVGAGGWAPSAAAAAVTRTSKQHTHTHTTNTNTLRLRACSTSSRASCRRCATTPTARLCTARS